MVTQKKTPQGRSFTFSFSPAGLLSLVLFAIIALAWAFIFGLLLGRGYQPEELVPEIAKIMPTPPPPPLANVNESLRPEDLDFYEQLKTIPAEENPVHPEPEQVNKPKTTTPKNVVVTEESKPQSAVPDKPKTTEEPFTPQPEKKAPAKPEQKAKTNFLFRYQILSLEDGASALGVQKRLRAKGIKASTTKITIEGKIWYRIIVEIRGDEEDVKVIADKLKKEGFPDMILNEKKRLD